jgi:predicted esterase
MLELNIEPIEERLNKATIILDKQYNHLSKEQKLETSKSQLDEEYMPEWVELYANAEFDISDLLAEVKRLREENKELKRQRGIAMDKLIESTNW